MCGCETAGACVRPLCFPVCMRLFAHARVRSLETPETVADAVLVDDAGRIAGIGSTEEMRELASSAGVRADGTANAGRLEEIDCAGGVLLPGLVDAHAHALSAANTLSEIDLRAVRSLTAAVDTIRAHAQTLPEGEWITGGRWDSNTWLDSDGRRGLQPDRELLDAAVPDRPVALWSIDYHTLWLNGAALAAVGIDDSTPNPRGGEIVRDASGKATGILREDAATIAERRIPPMPIAARVESMRRAQRRWLAEGLTGVHDIDGTVSREAWEGLIAADELRMRVVKYLRLDEWEWAKETGWRTGGAVDARGRFVRGGLKLFSDGALGSQTSYMTDPFPSPGGEDHLPNYGLPIATEDVLVEQIEEAVACGVSTAIHAIGDRANHHVLAALARTQQATEAARARFGAPMRHRIEHAQFVRPEDVARFRELGVVASMQPRHCISDLHLLASLQPDPRLAAYAWKDLIAAGAHLAFGSDAPVEPTNPFAGIYAAMTRAHIDGDPATTFQPERRIPAIEALRAHTTGAAYAAGLEAQTGRLAPGFDADLIVVDVDPLESAGGSGVTGEYASEAALFEHAVAVRDTQVHMAVVGGEVEFAR